MKSAISRKLAAVCSFSKLSFQRTQGRCPVYIYHPVTAASESDYQTPDQRLHRRPTGPGLKEMVDEVQ
jgi:hypothetical protein